MSSEFYLLKSDLFPVISEALVSECCKVSNELSNHAVNSAVNDSLFAVIKGMFRINIHDLNQMINLAFFVFKNEFFQLIIGVSKNFEISTLNSNDPLRLVKSFLKLILKFQTHFNEQSLADMLKSSLNYDSVFCKQILELFWNSVCSHSLNSIINEDITKIDQLTIALDIIEILLKIHFFKSRLLVKIEILIEKIIKISFFLKNNIDQGKRPRKCVESILSKIFRNFGPALNISFGILRRYQHHEELHDFTLFLIFSIQNVIEDNHREKLIYLLDSLIEDESSVECSTRALKLIKVHHEIIATCSVSFISKIFSFFYRIFENDRENEYNLCSKASKVLKSIVAFPNFDYKFMNIIEFVLNLFELSDRVSNASFIELLEFLLS
jgi:hypothetical protein